MPASTAGEQDRTKHSLAPPPASGEARARQALGRAAPGAAPGPARPLRTGPSPKACDACGGQRIRIGAGFGKVSRGRVALALVFVYAPILLLPFVALAAASVYLHLRLLGATDLKGLRDFMPARHSHRYGLKTQIVRRDLHPLAFWARARAFWVFNCTLYCPLSVALLEWAAYLTKAVENWWCPFRHARKPGYAGSAIDRSYWHVSEEARRQLHPEDRDGAIWNEDAPSR